MAVNYELKRIFFIDVETVSNHKDYDSLDTEWRELWDRKAQNISRWSRLDKTPNELYDRAGIYAEFGKIVCISVGYFHQTKSKELFRVKSFYHDDEKELLQSFQELLAKNHPRKFSALCAHNGKEFDYPYLCRRMMVHGIALPNVLKIQGKKPWELNHLLDTMQLWSFGDYKHYTSLALLAAALKIVPSKTQNMSGDKVHSTYYDEKSLATIVEYCQQDVITLASVYCALQEESRNLSDMIEIVE